MTAKNAKRSSAGKDDGDGLIADYEWLRRMMHHLEVQTEQVDRQLIEIEKNLPDDYTFPGDPPEGRR